MEIPGQPVPSTPPPATTSSRDAWERIKQHKVVQWTLAYLALAYTLLHGAELLGNSLGWSHGLLRVFTLLLIMGVPVVIIVSWYHGARGITVAKDPKFARAWEVLGAVLVIGRSWDVGDQHDWQTGADAIDTALRLDPNLSLAYAVRAEVQGYLIPSRGALAWEEASDDLSRAIEHDGTNGTAYLWRGENYASLGYFGRAIQDYQRCLEIDPACEVDWRKHGFPPQCKPIGDSDFECP